MSFCPNCGTEVPESVRFCPNCGVTISAKPTDLKTPFKSPLKVVSSNLIERMIRAAKLDPNLYDEVEMDQGATKQALLVVVITSICSGIGIGIGELLSGEGILSIMIGVISALFSWFIWSFITYFIGTKIFRGIANFGEMLRCLGFSNSPGVLNILSFIPIIGGIISFITSIWGLLAMVIAVRQALDFSTGKAILTCIVGWLVSLILALAMGLLFAIPLLGI